MSKVIEVVKNIFRQAYKNATGSNVSKEEAKKASSVAELTKSSTRGMSFEQSLQVLNIELNNNKITDNDVKRAKENYDRLFEINGTADGSFYIKSKVFRAKERFDAECLIKGVEPEAVNKSDENNLKEGDDKPKSL